MDKLNEQVIQAVTLFFGSNFEVIEVDEYWLKIKNESGEILTITSEAGSGYNEGTSWLKFKIETTP